MNTIPAQGYRLLRVWYCGYEWAFDDNLPVLGFAVDKPGQPPEPVTLTGDTLLDELAEAHRPPKDALEAIKRQAGVMSSAIICPNGTVIDAAGQEFHSVESYLVALRNRELCFRIKAARRRVGLDA